MPQALDVFNRPVGLDIGSKVLRTCQRIYKQAISVLNRRNQFCFADTSAIERSQVFGSKDTPNHLDNPWKERCLITGKVEPQRKLYLDPQNESSIVSPASSCTKGEWESAAAFPGSEELELDFMDWVLQDYERLDVSS